MEVRLEFYTIREQPTYLTVMAAGSKGENALNMPTCHNKYVCRPFFSLTNFWLVHKVSTNNADVFEPLNSRKLRHSTR